MTCPLRSRTLRLATKVTARDPSGDHWRRARRARGAELQGGPYSMCIVGIVSHRISRGGPTPTALETQILAADFHRKSG